ncbi:MAG: hypothetical protein C9356_09275 [Oleiphilus sp.]|nr:MAG: hypothetical protein C9356_09275 [Oleiphilus sp.]
MAKKTIKMKIETQAEMVSHFIVQEVATGKKFREDNVRNIEFDVEEGTKMASVVEVTGANGSKYKLKITGATKATYPTSEQQIDDNRDLILARITA